MGKFLNWLSRKKKWMEPSEGPTTGNASSDDKSRKEPSLPIHNSLPLPSNLKSDVLVTVKENIVSPQSSTPVSTQNETLRPSAIKIQQRDGAGGGSPLPPVQNAPQPSLTPKVDRLVVVGGDKDGCPLPLTPITSQVRAPEPLSTPKSDIPVEITDNNETPVPVPVAENPNQRQQSHLMIKNEAAYGINDLPSPPASAQTQYIIPGPLPHQRPSPSPAPAPAPSTSVSSSALNRPCSQSGTESRAPIRKYTEEQKLPILVPQKPPQPSSNPSSSSSAPPQSTSRDNQPLNSVSSQSTSQIWEYYWESTSPPPPPPRLDPSILKISPDLHLAIANYLDYPEAIMLKLTCKKLYNNIPLPKTQPKTSQKRFILEKFPSIRTFDGDRNPPYLCSDCMMWHTFEHMVIYPAPRPEFRFNSYDHFKQQQRRVCVRYALKNPNTRIKGALWRPGHYLDDEAHLCKDCKTPSRWSKSMGGYRCQWNCDKCRKCTDRKEFSRHCDKCWGPQSRMVYKGPRQDPPLQPLGTMWDGERRGTKTCPLCLGHTGYSADRLAERCLCVQEKHNATPNVWYD